MKKLLKFSTIHTKKPKLRKVDIESQLKHFSIISFYVDPEVISNLIHPRFKPVIIKNKIGEQKAIFSVIPFLDNDFHFKGIKFLKFKFGQTNYRTYVIDKKTGEHVVWFLGTSLDSITYLIPKYIWKLPWHKNNIQFHCKYSNELNKYESYKCETKSGFGKNKFELEDLGRKPDNLPGFSDLETGLVIITHPFKGYYFKSNGDLGSYSIWHKPLNLNEGKLKYGNFVLLKKYNIWDDKNEDIHSVLIQHETAFSIYLPPKTIT